MGQREVRVTLGMFTILSIILIPTLSKPVPMNLTAPRPLTVDLGGMCLRR